MPAEGGPKTHRIRIIIGSDAAESGGTCRNAPPTLIDDDRMPQRHAPDYPPCKTKTLSERERRNDKPLTITRGSPPELLFTSTWPKHCTCTTAHNANPQAIVDAKAYSEAHSEATKQDDACETKASAVECMCEQEATLHREGCRKAKGWMEN